MVHTSNALITATLALSAAALIFAAPVQPRINSGFSSVNIHAPIPPPIQSPATVPVAVPAPAPALEAAAELEARGAMIRAAVGGAVSGGSFSVINNPIQHLFSRAGLPSVEAQPVPSVDEITTDGSTTDPQPQFLPSMDEITMDGPTAGPLPQFLPSMDEITMDGPIAGPLPVSPVSKLISKFETAETSHL